MGRVSAAILSGVLVAAASVASAAIDVTIRWTGPGIPHVTASSYESLGYGYGYVIARDRLCLIADRVVSLRGERSRWYGPDKPAVVGFMPTTNLDADLFYRVQLSEESAAAAAKRLDPRVRAISRGYAAGFNRYVKDLAPAEGGRLCPGAPLPQMSENDVVRAMLSIGAAWKAFQIAPFAKVSAWGGTADQAAAVPSQEPISASLGSNAWAYGADVTRTASAIVVANPHTVWRGHWLSMHQMHLTVPGQIDVAGADFAGLPLPLTGFNRDVAWTLEAPSTVTYYVLQRMEVEDGKEPAYLLDGKRKPLRLSPIEVPVKRADGSIATERFPIAYSELGALYRLPQRGGRPAGWYAITDAGEDNAEGLNQLLQIALARNVAGFVSALERNRGLGAHFIVGDRHGEVAYVESGPLLDITDEALDACRIGGEGVPFNVLDGSRSACAMRTAGGEPRLLAADKFPALRGRGIIQNTNGSYRFSMHGRDTQGYSRFLGDPSAEPANLRLRMSQRRMTEIARDGEVSNAEALQVIFDNRNYAAETWLDPLLAVCRPEPSTPQLKKGCAVLAAWDRRNEGASRGTLLFNEFWKRASQVAGLFAAPVDPAKPFAVRPLADTESVRTGVASALTEAVNSLEALGLDGSEPWGQILAARTSSGRIPLHGGSAEQGVLNVLEGTNLGRDGFAEIASGTDYVQQVHWEGGKLVAHTLLAHGQSDDPQSPHYADQLESFSAKRLAKFPYTAAEIRADAQLETLRLRDR